VKRSSQKKSWRKGLLFWSLFVFCEVRATPIGLLQLPEGPKVVSGQISMIRGESSLNIHQSTAKAIVDWKSFHVGERASVHFLQPDAQSAVLNRVHAGEASQILGKVSSNGQVFLINPQGVYFGPSSSVDVGSLMATTHQISNDNFLNGRFQFARESASGNLVNEGTIKAASGGFLALLAPHVTNAGNLLTTKGTVALLAADMVELRFSDGILGVITTPSTVRALVENRKLIVAQDGQAILSAQAVNSLIGGIVKNSGAIEANGMVGNGGRVLLTASDTVEHSGKIVANAGRNGNGGQVLLIANLNERDSRTTVEGEITARGGVDSGDGGFVETSASQLYIDRAQIKVSAPHGRQGTWLLDPGEIIIQSQTGVQSTQGASAFDSPNGWTSSSGTVNANWCINSACGYSTNSPYIGSSKTGTGVVQFSYTRASVSRVFPLDASSAELTLSASVLPKGAVSGTGFPNAGNIRIEFLDRSGGMINSQTSDTLTQSSNVQALTLPNMSIPVGATHVRVVLQQTTSGNYWAGNYGIAFSDLRLQQIGEAAAPGGIFATLASGGSVTVQTDATLAGSGNIYVNSRLPVNGSGNLSLIASNDIVVNQPIVMAGSNQTVTLSAQRAFVNNVGPSAIEIGQESNMNRWVIYTNSPSDNKFGGLLSGQLPLWGYAPGAVLPSSAVGNRYVFKARPELTVTPVNVSKIYGEPYDLSAVTYDLSGFIQSSIYGGVFNQENLANTIGTLVFSSAGSSATAATGNYELTSTAALATAGYSVKTIPSSVTVLPKQVTLKNITAASKTYDGSRSANITTGTLSGTVQGETLFVNGQGLFDSPDAGRNKTVTVADVSTLNLTNGTGHWANYRLIGLGPISTSADVNAPTTVTVFPTFTIPPPANNPAPRISLVVAELTNESAATGLALPKEATPTVKATSTVSVESKSLSIDGSAPSAAENARSGDESGEPQNGKTERPPVATSPNATATDQKPEEIIVATNQTQSLPTQIQSKIELSQTPSTPPNATTQSSRSTKMGASARRSAKLAQSETRKGCGLGERCVGAPFSFDLLSGIRITTLTKPFSNQLERRLFEQALSTAVVERAIAESAASPAGGDPLVDSLSLSPSTKNATSLARGKTKSNIEFEQQLESVNLINTLLLFILK